MQQYTIVVLAAVVVAAFAAPAAQSDSDEIAARLASLQEQLNALRGAVPHHETTQQKNLEARFPSYASPQKRLVAWQPMKRSSGPAEVELDREAVFRIIESRLMEVLAAGERLGVSAEEILEHVRARNSQH